MWDVTNTTTMYELQALDIDLFIMGRPWLKADDFEIKNT